MYLHLPRRRAALSFVCCALILGGALAAAPLLADDSELPEADEIIDRHIEAIGGEDAIRAHSSATAKGAFEAPAVGMSADMTLYQVAPDQGMLHMNMHGIGESVQVYNGEIGWSEDPMQGTRLLKGAELSAIKRQLGLHTELQYEENYPERKTVGEAEWNGQAAFQVDLVDVDGNESSRYFAKDTGLLLGEEGSQTSEMGTWETSTTLGDYKEFGGVMFSTSTTTNIPAMGMEFILTIDSVTFDDVDPSVFEPSDAIKALLPE